MKFAEQKEFKLAKPEDVIKHLKSVKRDTFKTDPLSLRLKTGTGADAEKVFLMVSNGYTKFYDVRKSFLMKLLKWYNFPAHILPRLSTETVVSAANDFLLNIKSGEVFIKLENEEALTITSNRYTDIPDLDIIELCKHLGFDKVSRNDFFMSIYSKEIVKTEPIPGDTCGFGYNIFNSETGFGALQISHYILRYICSNGATVGINDEGWKPLIHYNISHEDVLNYINTSIQQLQARRYIIVNKLKTLKEQEVKKNNLETIKRKLSGLLGYQVSHKLIEEFDLRTKHDENDFDGSQYSLFNFLTYKAQSFDIYRRTQLEQLAGNIFLS